LRICGGIRGVDSHLIGYHLKKIRSSRGNSGNRQRSHQYLNVADIAHRNIEVFLNLHYPKVSVVEASAATFMDELSFLEHRSQSVCRYLHTSYPSFYLIECDP